MFNLRYVLLSPHHPNQETRHLLNITYESWKNTFSKVVEDKGGDLNKDDFFRYDLIGALFYEDKLVGSHCYSLFDLSLNCCLDHHFMQEIAPETIDKLLQKKQQLIYSLEYTNILPEFRKDSSNIRWVDVLTGCALKMLDGSVANGIIGTPRTDIKVDKTAIRLGAEEIQPPFKKMNYECSVIYFPKRKDRALPDPAVNQLVQQAWNGLNINPTIADQKAA